MEENPDVRLTENRRIPTQFIYAGHRVNGSSRKHGGTNVIVAHHPHSNARFPVHHEILGSASVGCPCVSRHAARKAGSNKGGGTRVTALIAEVPHEWEVDTCGLGKGAAWTGSGEEVRTDPGCLPSL